MKIRYLTLSLLAALSMGSAQAAVPSVGPNLGTDPLAAPVAGFVMFGSTVSSYTFNLSSLSSLSGSLFGFGTVSFSSILVDSTPVVLSGGTFNVAGLGQGVHTLTFNYNSPSMGGFGGTVSSTVTPVPEAGSVAMALAGAALVAVASRRRRAG
ncbi:MAG: hypothetical protein RLZZ182_2662 [Pseudomonadota bacterium]|jgi:hypothetical protein